MSSEERTPLFVRLPAAQARRVDAAARQMGRTKQDYVASVLAASLEQVEREPRAPADGSSLDGTGRDEVLTLRELARLLRIDSRAVKVRVEAGELPGRRFGDEWRFSRDAVFAWLDGSDADRRPYGFQSVPLSPAPPERLQRKGRRS